MISILKLLSPTLIKTIINYVTKDNNLDLEVRIINERLKKLEKHTHPKRELVCKGKNKCKLVE